MFGAQLPLQLLFLFMLKVAVDYVIAVCSIPIELKLVFKTFYQLNHFIVQDKKKNCAIFYANLF